MQHVVENSAINAKIQELCQTILLEPWFKGIQARVETFLQNEEAQAKYLALNEKGEMLQHKQSQGMHITPDEVGEFERLREEFFLNSVARDFVEAQEEMSRVKTTLERQVEMTFELGRLPTPEDLQGGCGSGCGCSH